MKTTTNTLTGNNPITLMAALLFSFLCFSACSKNEISFQEENTLKTTDLPYTIAGTNQTRFYGNFVEIPAPEKGQPFYGQDANYPSNSPDYTDNDDGTITDKATGLMWQKDPGVKVTYDEAVANAKSVNLAGYSDWRLPSVKELYSLIIFSGLDPSDPDVTTDNGLTPFIDTRYFIFSYGKAADGDRIIDSQFASSTLDVGDSQFGGGHLMFGVNFADGRIKGYPTGPMPGQSTGKKFYVLYVRGNENYGKNNFVDNGNGTITDSATGLMWMQDDSGKGLTWEEALKYAQNQDFAGFNDWRLPTVKELQSIVDYSRAPGATNSAAIDPLFHCTKITNEARQTDYAYYWSSTTHANMRSGASAAYVSFGRAMGYFNGVWQDVHGAGAQRSDPKTGDPADYPFGHGPQGDAIRIQNFVRLVRNIP